MKAFLTCCLMSILVSPVLAFGSSTYPYVSFTLGTPLTSINKLSDKTGSLNTDSNPGYMAGLCAGVTFETKPGWNIEQVRAEAEIGYRTNDLVKMSDSQGQSANMNVKVTVTNFMLNGYLENTSLLASNVPINIFITAGVGGAMASTSLISFPIKEKTIPSSNDTQLAYQGGLGAGYQLTNRFTLDAVYKYLGTTPFNFSGVKAEYGSHNILLGARYSFK